MSVENETSEAPIALERVEVASDSADAEILRGVLEGEGLAVWIRERGSGEAIGLYTAHTNSVFDIYVTAENAEKARTVLAAYDNERIRISDEELAAAAETMHDDRV